MDRRHRARQSDLWGHGRMTDQRPPRRRRPRLSADEHARLLAEIATLADAKAGPRSGQARREAGPVDPQDRALRAALTEGVVPQDGTTPEDTPQPQSPAKPEQGPAPAPIAEAPPATAPDVWSRLLQVPVNEAALARNLIITAQRVDPAHAAFDVLRARLVQALADRGWRRVGITSPSRDCGKTFAAANLAITLSRYDACRTLLMDMDMRNPSVAKTIGLRSEASMGAFLRGEVATDAFVRRVAPNGLNIGGNLALGLNGVIEPYAAELFHEERCAGTLQRLEAEIAPDVILFDLPPALAQDDVIAFRRHMDCVLMVVGGGITKASDVRESVRRLGDDMPIVGVVMNKAEGEGVDLYGY